MCLSLCDGDILSLSHLKTKKRSKCNSDIVFAMLHDGVTVFSTLCDGYVVSVSLCAL